MAESADAGQFAPVPPASVIQQSVTGIFIMGMISYANLYTLKLGITKTYRLQSSFWIFLTFVAICIETYYFLIVAVSDMALRALTYEERFTVLLPTIAFSVISTTGALAIRYWRLRTFISTTCDPTKYPDNVTHNNFSNTTSIASPNGQFGSLGDLGEKGATMSPARSNPAPQTASGNHMLSLTDPTSSTVSATNTPHGISAGIVPGGRVVQPIYLLCTVLAFIGVPVALGHFVVAAMAPVEQSSMYQVASTLSAVRAVLESSLHLFLDVLFYRKIRMYKAYWPAWSFTWKHHFALAFEFFYAFVVIVVAIVRVLLDDKEMMIMDWYLVAVQPAVALQVFMLVSERIVTFATYGGDFRDGSAWEWRGARSGISSSATSGQASVTNVGTQMINSQTGHPHQNQQFGQK